MIFVNGGGDGRLSGENQITQKIMWLGLQSPVHVSYFYLCILSQLCKEDIRTGAKRHRAKKKERIKSRIGKVKKLKVMLQKRLKTVKNKCCGLGHEMRDCPYR